MGETITCPACGTEAAANAGFCFHCGKGFKGKYLLAEDEARRMAERGIASPPPAAGIDTVGLGSSGAPGRSQSLQYRTVPFRATLQSNQGVDTAANQLQAVINAHAAKGWTFCSVAQVHALVQPGCLGGLLGHSAVSVAHDYIVFSAPVSEKQETR